MLIAAAVVLWRAPRNSRWHWKLLGRMTAGILLCASALTLLLFLFRGVMCGRYEFPPIPSSDGKLAAEVSEEDCGAGEGIQPSCLRSDTTLGWLISLGRSIERCSFVTRTILASLPNFAVNRSGRAFKSSTLDIPRIMANPLARCPPSRDGCGEGRSAVVAIALAKLE